MDEQEREATIRKIAEDMAAAGLGWHEGYLLRLTAPPILTAEQVQAVDRLTARYAAMRRRQLFGSESRRRARRRARKARKGR